MSGTSAGKSALGAAEVEVVRVRVVGAADAALVVGVRRTLFGDLETGDLARPLPARFLLARFLAADLLWLVFLLCDFLVSALFVSDFSVRVRFFAGCLLWLELVEFFMVPPLKMMVIGGCDGQVGAPCVRGCGWRRREEDKRKGGDRGLTPVGSD